MPIDVEQDNRPGWWMKRLFFQLNDPRWRRRLWKLHNYYARSPPLPEGAEAAREAFEAFQRHIRSNFAELVVSAVSERMTPVGFRTARDEDVTGDAEAAAVWERAGLSVRSSDTHSRMLSLHDHVQPRSGQGDGLEEVAGEQGVGFAAEEVGPGGGRALGRGVDPSLVENFPHGGGGGLDPQDEQFGVDAAVTPAGVLPSQAQHQGAYGADGVWPARPFWPGIGSVAARGEVAVPAQHRVRAHQQLEPMEHAQRKPVQQDGEERSVAGGEPRPGLAQLSLEDRDLVAQRQDLHVLVPVAHRKQPQ
ncbi:hypothetical protein [Micromonospora coerulea]|uniref:hypothetical protein n=1 Tax=Micromonospora coerulea TaxID=47856 RepID=UPI00190492B8|nr:hypothetical protein [Micromonospora veneta]